jgi:O-antigen/teichoic acid export membrane protein
LNSSVKKLLRNIFANQLGFLVSVVVTFFLSPFVVNSLGGTRYGIWSLIVSLTGNYGLLAFGIQGAMTRYIAHAAATNDRERVNGYFNTALSFLLGSAALVIIVGLVVSLFIDTIFVLPKDMVEEARSACVLVTFSAAATFAFAAFDSVLVAHQRFQLINAVGTVTTLIRAGMTVWILKQGYGIVALSALGTGLTLFNGLIVAAVAKRMYSLLSLSLSLARKNYLKELLDYGYKSFTVGIAAALVYQFDLFVCATYLPPDKVARYSLAATLITYSIQFLNAIITTLGPLTAELYATKRIEDLRTLFINGSKIMYMIGGLMVSGALIFGKSFYTLWVGSNYSDCSVILSILIIPIFFVAGSRVGGSIISGMARVGPMAIASIFEGIGNLLLSLILVRYYGLIGVAFGTLIPSVIINGLWSQWFVSRLLEIDQKVVLIKSMLPGVLAGLVAFGVGSLLYQILTPFSWRIFVLDVIVIAICTTIVAALMCLNTKTLIQSIVTPIRNN